MKKEDLFEIMGDLDEKEILNAGGYAPDAALASKEASPLRRLFAGRRFVAVAACAVLVLVSLAGIRILRNGFLGIGTGGNTGPGQEAGGAAGTAELVDASDGLVTIKAELPEPTAPNMSASQFLRGDGHYDWWVSYMDSRAASAELQGGMSGYYLSIMDRLLTDESQNTVCSPLNIYLAVSTLAEMSDGNTRRQVLDFLGVSDIRTLRESVATLWASNYVDTPLLKSLLASSLWLNGSVPFRQETLSRLASTYCTSSFLGDPSSKEMNEALRSWTDENTGNLLTEYTKDLSLDADTVLSLVSTLYYKAMWEQEFSEDETSQEIFHGTEGDTSVDMMHRTAIASVYGTDGFTALGLGLSDSGGMYIFLPDEGVSVESLVTNPEILNASSVMFYEDEHISRPIVHLSLPKFTVSQKADLIETLKALGITDALDASLADFTPLTEADEPIFVSSAEHAAMVEIDEHGVTGAAYTDLALAGGAAIPEDEMYFTVDRPFLFLITGRDNSVLFAGIIRNIE